MKVLELKSKKLIDVNNSYGARLIEQGKAILPPAGQPAISAKADKGTGKKGDA